MRFSLLLILGLLLFTSLSYCKEASEETQETSPAPSSDAADEPQEIAENEEEEEWADDKDEELEEDEDLPDAPIEGEEEKKEEEPLEPLEIDKDTEKELEGEKEDFVQFHKQFKRNIKKDQVKKAARNFKANNKRLKALKSKKKNFKVGMNKFMHMDKDERKKLLIPPNRKHNKQKMPKAGKKSKKPRTKAHRPKAGARKGKRGKRALPKLPKNFDWRKKGYVNPVRDQGDCGACWTFSTAGVIEVNYARAHKTRVDISEESMTCVYNESTICEGGFPDEAFAYIKKAGGIGLERAFPYTQKYKSKCKQIPVKAKVVSFADLLPFKMNKVRRAIVKNGPISIGMYINDDFDYYAGGIFDTPCTKKDDSAHAMMIVGYGEEKGVPYWIVRNTWAKDWGENGYIRIKAGVNLCEIESFFMIQAKVV